MTEDNITETSEGTEQSESGEESPVLKTLRQRVKELERELKSAPKRSDLEAEIRASLARELAIERELVALNYPHTLRPLVDEKLGDAEVAREGVAAALKALGFEVSDSSESGAVESPVVNELAEVANLGSQVAQAATGKASDNLTDKINAAQTPAELAAVMREAGLGQ